jgi:hypothetical protein
VSIEGLMGRLVAGAGRRDFEVWETAAAGQPSFMLAAALTRQQAVGMANARALLRPRPGVRVLDRLGNLVYRV